MPGQEARTCVPVMPQRLRAISQGVTQLMEIYQPDEVAFEELFFFCAARSSIA